MVDTGGEFIDPFKFVGSEPNIGKPAPGATGIAEHFSAGMIERAQKRTVTVIGEKEYNVSSLPGESRALFPVYLTPEGEWECYCFTLDHGDTRRRKGCTHLAAVLLYREAKSGGSAALGVGAGEATEAAVSEGVIAPSSEPPVPEEVYPTKYPIPAPDDEMWKLPPGTPPFPSWVQEFRPHQWQAAIECVEAFESGADIVWLDAPTGAGKTLIAELVRRLMAVPTWYICTTKTLQDQFARDFDYSKVLKGRSNYPTTDFPFPEYTANDCTNDGGSQGRCYWCREVTECPYSIAKKEAVESQLGVINTAYLLAEANIERSVTTGRALVIADECDVLEGDLMGYVTYEVSERRLNTLGISAPKKGVRKKTIRAWMTDTLLPAIDERLKDPPNGSSELRVIRERTGLYRLRADTLNVLYELEAEAENADPEVTGAENWIRDNAAGPLVMKPVRVNRYGREYLWQHADHWLCMSGTIVSSDEMDASLGVVEAGLKSVTVHVPMTFPVQNRPVTVVPVIEMTYANREKAQPVMAEAIKVILKGHSDERVLIHTVSYQFAEYLRNELSGEFADRLVTHSNAAGRDEALGVYRRRPGGVLLSPSMDRGVDLKGDDCRVVVVCKVPFGNIGDRQVSARLRGVGGQQWYNVQAIRTLLQMTGRGVRSKDDWCQTYILDAQFTKKIWKVRAMIPQWWIDSVTIARVRDYIGRSR